MKIRARIGIMTPRRQLNKSIYELYRRHTSRRIDLFVFTPMDIKWKQRRIIGWHRVRGKWKQTVFPFPKVVYNRCYAADSSAAKRLGEEGGADVFNRVTRFNKWEVHQLLRQSPLASYLPETFLLDTVDPLDLLRRLPFIIIKPVAGCRGNRVYRLQRTANGEVQISLHAVAPAEIISDETKLLNYLRQTFTGRTFLVQEGIETCKAGNRFFDIRTLVQKNAEGNWTVSSTICRLAHQGYYNTSMYEQIREVSQVLRTLFPDGKWKDVKKTIRDLSLNAAITVEQHYGMMGELSVDLVVDQRLQFWIIELNASPEKNLYRDPSCRSRKRINRMFSLPMQYAEYLFRRRHASSGLGRQPSG